MRCVIPFVIFRFLQGRTLVTCRPIISREGAYGPIAVFCFTTTLSIILTSNGIPRGMAPMRRIRLMTRRRLSVFPLYKSVSRGYITTFVMKRIVSFSICPTFMLQGVYATVRAQRRRILYVLVFCASQCFGVQVFFIQ